MCGEAGELEQTALWDVPGGYVMRVRLRAAELLLVLAMRGCGRIHDRMDGLTTAEVKGEYWLRQPRFLDSWTARIPAMMTVTPTMS